MRMRAPGRVGSQEEGGLSSGVTIGAAILTAAVIGAGCSAGGASSRPWQGIGLSVQQERVCDRTADAGECARAIEAGRWNKLDRFAERRGGLLELSLANGKTRRFQDANGAGAPGVQYSLIDFVRPADSYVVFERSPKGSKHLLVLRADGSVARLDSAPVFSPDGSYFVTTSADAPADAGAIRVYRTAARPKMEWSLEPGTWGPGLPKWLDDSTIHIPTNGPGPAAGSGEKVPSELTVRRSSGGLWYAVLSFESTADTRSGS
jgi:hypothetical protein